MSTIIRPALLALATCALFVAMAGLFALRQSIWIDETTQLSGLALDFRTQLAWLAGSSDVILGVPPDRMPPLSYWLGGLWTEVFGLTEGSMRWFGIVTVLVGAPALYLAGRRAAGPWGGVFSLTFVLLSPGILVQAVEIRAYPLFLTFSAWGYWCFAELVLAGKKRARGTRWLLILLAVFILAASYTHYYGLVFGFCLLCTLIADRVFRGLPVVPVLVVASGTVVISVGLVPFLLSAAAMTASATSGSADIIPSASSLTETLVGLARLSLRSFLHGSHLVYPTIAIVAVLGVVSLAGLALVGRSMAARSNMLLMPVLVGLVLLAIANLMNPGFSVLAPHYNLWMIPPVAVFLARAFVQGAGKRLRIILQRAGASAIILAHLSASVVLLSNARYFTHGPGEWVASMISDPNRTLVLHDSTGPWAQAYFPLYALTEGEAAQILLVANEEPVWLTATGRKSLSSDINSLLAEFDTVLYVSIRDRNTQFLGRRIRNGETCGGSHAIPLPDISDRFMEPKFYCAYASATLMRVAPIHD